MLMVFDMLLNHTTAFSFKGIFSSMRKALAITDTQRGCTIRIFSKTNNIKTKKNKKEKLVAATKL